MMRTVAYNQKQLIQIAIVALLLIYGLAALIGTVVSDIILTVADPRVRMR